MGPYLTGANTQGLQNKGLAEQLGVRRVQVARWRDRYLESGLQGIERDLPRGAPAVKVDVAKLVELTQYCSVRRFIAI